MWEPHPVSLCRTTDWPTAHSLFDCWLKEEVRFLFGLRFNSSMFVKMIVRYSYLNNVWVKSRCQKSFISVILRTISHVYVENHRIHFLVWYYWWNREYCSYETSNCPSSQQSSFFLSMFLMDRRWWRCIQLKMHLKYMKFTRRSNCSFWEMKLMWNSLAIISL